MTRLSASDAPRPLVLEIRGDDSGVQHLFGCLPTAVWQLKRLIANVLPHAITGKAVRTPVTAAGRVAVPKTGLPLSTPNAEELVNSIYGALATRKTGESLALQVVLGRTRPAHTIRADIPDPLQSLPGRLWSGPRKAPAETRRRLVEHAAGARLDIVLRLGVASDDPTRRSHLIQSLFGSLQSLQSAGVRLHLARERATALDSGRFTSTGLRVSVAELAPLLAWPIEERDYPGIDPLHPKRLPVPTSISKTESVFAIGAAPGSERPIGFTPADRLAHTVVLGPTGSGKSQLLEHLILSDIIAGRACVVVEPKKQLVDSILDRVQPEATDRIVVLDAADHHPVGLNPLDVGDRDDDTVVDGILAALKAVFDDGWGPRTEYLIQGSLLTLARAGRRRGEPYTLLDLPTLLTESAFRRTATSLVRDDPTLAAFWAEYEDLRPGQRAAMIAAPLNKLRKLVLRKHVAAVLGQSRPRFRLRDVFRDGKTVLVPLNDALIGTGAATLLGSLVVAEIWMATLERAAERNPTSRPGMVFVDEVQNYLHLPTPISDALATSRSYGVAWHVAHQYREQLPPAMRAAFDTNARSKLCFALGPHDAREMAKMAPQLDADDFQLLDQYEIYARLVTGGAPAGWFSAKTLPPLPPTGAGEQIRQASRDRYGAIPSPTEPSSSPLPAFVASDASTSPGTSETTGEQQTAGEGRPRGQKARRT